MSEAVLFVVAFLAIVLIFGIGSFFVRRAYVRVDDLNASLVEYVCAPANTSFIHL
jgi:hypothetical protein